MDRRLALALLLIALCVLVTGSGLWQARALRQASADSGPHTLLRDGHGGFWLATHSELLHLDAGGALRDRHSAAALGLTALDAVATGEGAVLWAHDRSLRRLFRCDTAAWTCKTAGDASVALGAPLELAWLYGRDRRLLATDSAGQRLLAFDAEGRPLPVPPQSWQAPQQLATGGGEVLLAEAGARRVVSIDPVANQPGATALMTRSAPSRFLRRDNHWWVLEGSAPLRLRHYLDGVAADIALPVRDPVALLDGGRAGLLLASRDDWRLLTLDPETGEITDLGDLALQQALLSRARTRREAQAALAQLPWIVLPLAVLTGLPVPVLLWRRWRGRRVAENPGGTDGIRPRPGNSASTPATAFARASSPLAAQASPSIAIAATSANAREDAGRLLRIDTRRDLLEQERARQEQQFKWLLRGAGLLLAMAGLACARWPDLRDGGSAWVVTALIAIAPLFVRGQLIIARRHEDRLYDRHLVCGAGKVVLVTAGKPVMAVAYDAIWLGEHSLVLGALRMPLYRGRGTGRRPVWDVDALEATLAPRLAAGRRLPEGALGRALLAQGQWQGLLILVQALPYPLAIPLILLLLLECWRWLAPGLPFPPAP